MLAAMCHYPWHASDEIRVGLFRGGRVKVHGTLPAIAPASATRGPLTVLFDGELYAGPGLTDRDLADPAAAVARGVCEGGAAFLRQVHGCFVLAIWDSEAQRLTLANDRFGTRPMYWAQLPAGDLLFAAEVNALLAHPRLRVSRSTTGLAEFLCFGQLIGDSTLYENVRALPGAAWLTWHAATRRVAVDQYATLDPDEPARSAEEWLDEMDARVVAAVRQSCSHGGRVGLSLSGGLDARTILGVAPDDVHLACVSLGVRGGIDHRGASELARLAGRPHYPQFLDGDFLGRFDTLLRQAVRLTSGHYLDQGIVLTTLPAYRELGIQTLLRGHAGELMHMTKAYAFSLDAEGLQIASSAQLGDWLWRHLTDYMIAGVEWSTLALPASADLRDAARASLDERLRRLEHIEPLQRVWHLFVTERVRREVAASLQMIRSFTEVRLPLVEPSLVSALSSAPVGLKLTDTIQTRILRKRRPSFLDVVNANTGAPMGAGALRTRAAQFKLRVYSKLRVPGYQPYERLGLWLARELQPLLKESLLSDRFLSWELFDRSGLERLIGTHRRRERNHTFLLMALLVLAEGESARESLAA